MTVEAAWRQIKSIKITLIDFMANSILMHSSTRNQNLKRCHDNWHYQVLRMTKFIKYHTDHAHTWVTVIM